MWMLLWLLQELQHDVYIIFTKQRDITHIWSADIQRVERSSNCYMFLLSGILRHFVDAQSALYKLFTCNFLKCHTVCFAYCFWRFLAYRGSSNTTVLHCLISPCFHWCSSASQITRLIVCTRCNYWSAGNLFGLEGFFSSSLSPAVALFPCG